MMTPNELADAIQYLKNRTGNDEDGFPLKLVLPYGVFPGARPGGVLYLNTVENWTRYQWNPPQFSEHTQSQDDVSAKPTWKMIVDAVDAVRIQQFEKYRGNAVEDLRLFTRQRICARIYMAHDIEDEIMNRAAGNYTTAQDTHRDAVIVVHGISKAAIQVAVDTDAVFREQGEAFIRINEAIDQPTQ